jgi:hypothetical protein
MMASVINVLLLVVADDLDILRTGVCPAEADTPLPPAA